ncbi:3-phytase A [Ceratocystis platani]|uniref:3-phytase n=1 Tax=Ceratocystis fimbriata f. sp. platani TaxID=88771 RepID=A0A0F8B070_CERFI|nr:3-phytase A [Ceratocystis platani]
MSSSSETLTPSPASRRSLSSQYLKPYGPNSSRGPWIWRYQPVRNTVFTLLGVGLAFVILKQAYVDSAGRDYISNYFQTKPELFPGPTATGKAAFLAQTMSFDPLATTIYEPNTPLQTVLPISGMPGGGKDGKNSTTNRAPVNIFRLMGNLSPYQPADGFGMYDPNTKIIARTTTQDPTERFKSMITGFDWTIDDTYAAQTLCPYETVAFGSSRFCDLFTYEEWEGFAYSLDLEFSASSGFQSPTGRAIGIGYQQEVVARLKNTTLDYSHSQINTTMDSSLITFPLNQSLYLDFSHDSNIISVLAAFGLRQFAEPLDPAVNPGHHNFSVAQLTPFGARLDIELIETPHPMAADRSGYIDKDSKGGGNVTRYVHFVLNQRTIPLGLSFHECDVERVDGWCELETFLKVQSKMAAVAQYDYACHGEVLDKQQFGKVTDGAPITTTTVTAA